ncbi:hypothetical protein ANO11243_080440 [Dothideomycetidae sp. 11243]|nr:hypothetical protein ANO11243_080440 [fungal sp. No.11243]
MERKRPPISAALAAVLPPTLKPWYCQGHLVRLNALLLVPLLSSTVVGYDGALINGMQSLPAFKASFSSPTGARLGLIIAAQGLGSLIALPVVPQMCDRLGRRPALAIGLAFTVMSAAINACSVNYAMLVAARALVGAGAVLAIQPAALLIAELAFPTHRPVLTAIFWPGFYLGSLGAAWSTYAAGTRWPEAQWSWRLPCAVQGALPVCQLLFIALLPESPRWLVARGHNTEALDILRRYHVATEAELEPLVELEMAEINAAIEIERAAGEGWSTLLMTPGNRRRMLIVVCVGAFAMWNGVTIGSFSLPLALETVGVKDSHSQTLINGLLQLFNFLSAIGAAFLVDRLGRRPLFLWSGGGMLVAFVALTACAGVFNETKSPAAGKGLIALVFVYFFHYDIAYTPLLLAYPTELLPFTVRAKGLTVELAVFYASLVVLSFINPIGLANIGWKYYLVFCGLLLGMLIISFLLFPETRGYTLEEVACIFDGPRIDHEQSNLEDGQPIPPMTITASTADDGGRN